MLERFLKLRNYVDCATAKSFAGGVEFGKLKSGLALSNLEVNLMQKLLEILDYAEEGDSLTGKRKMCYKPFE